MGLFVNSILITLALPEYKIETLLTEFEKLINNRETKIMELTQLFEKFYFSAAAVLPSRLHEKYLQLFQISTLRELSYQSIIPLDNSCLEKLRYSFFFDKLTKTWRKGKAPQNQTFALLGL